MVEVIEFKEKNNFQEKCGIYCRVSTEEQARKGLSMKAQADRCNAYALAKGWPVHKIYRDGGFSASTTQRPAFQHMLQDAEDGKFNIIIVYKIDRFSRRLKDLIDVLERLNDQQVHFSSVTEQFDTTTAMGEAFFHIVGVFAQLERKTIAERVMLTFDKKIKDGESLHRAPLGYIYRNKRLCIEETSAKRVKRIFDMWAAGIHYKEISKVVHVPISTLYEVIKNPIYIGKIRYKDKLFQGKHSSIVDEKLFYSINARSSKQQMKIEQF